MTPDLYSLVITLTASQRGHLRQSEGGHTHAAFLNIIRQIDPALSAELHTPNNQRTFTVSPLFGFRKAQKDGTIPIQPGDSGWLRITLLDTAIFRSFIDYFLYQTKFPAIRIGSAHFAINEILSNPSSHPWANVNSIMQLQDVWNSVETKQLSRKVTLDFTSPTSFSRRYSSDGQTRLGHRYTVTTPDPPFVFGNLASSWDRLANSTTSGTMRAFAADHIALASHQICTHMVDYGKGKRLIGFTGKATFEMLDTQNECLLRHMHRLADLAFYTGVGSKTAQMMGQVRQAKH